MLEILFFYVITFVNLKRKQSEVDISFPSEFQIESDSDDHEIRLSIISLLHLLGKTRSISSAEMFRQIEGHKPLGWKSLVYYFNHQNLIPEEFKNKTNLFIGTIFVNKNGTRFVPCLYYLPFQEKWCISFFCLLDQVSLNHNCIPIILENTN